MTSKQLQISRQDSLDPVITDFTTCLTCNKKCFCDCDNCGCLPCMLILQEINEIEMKIRGKVSSVAGTEPVKIIDSGFITKGAKRPSDDEIDDRDPKKREADFIKHVNEGFDKMENAVPYFPAIDAGEEVTMSGEEQLYWKSVVEKSTFPWVSAYACRMYRQFPFDPTYIRSFQPSYYSHVFHSRPAFICDRLYYKFRDGFTCPLLAYRWYTGKDKPSSRGKAAMYLEGRNYWFICPTDTTTFRVYQRLMRKLYHDDPKGYIEMFQRCCISWYGFEESLQYMKDFSMSNETDFAKSFCADRLDRLSWDDPRFFDSETALRLPEHDIDCLAYEEIQGGQTRARRLEVSTTWLGFHHLEVDFSWKDECRIPFDLVLKN